MCLSREEVKSFIDLHNRVLERAEEVIKSKNESEKVRENFKFDLSLPLSILCLHENGVFITNGRQTVQITKDELIENTEEVEN